MAFIGFLKETLQIKTVMIKIIKMPVYLWRLFLNLFSDKKIDDKEDEKIEELAQKMIQFTSLLDQRKYIPHGPAYSKLPDSIDVP